MDNWENLPIAALQAIAEARAYMEDVERVSVLRARQLGATWEDLGTALGVSRQTVFNRYGQEETDERASPRS